MTVDAHQVALPGGSWRLWRTAGLRGTGFPAGRVLALASPAAAAAADELNAARAEAAATRDAALDDFRAALDNLRARGFWDDVAQRRPLLRAVSDLNKDRLPDAAFAGWPAVARLAEARERAAGLAETYRKTFADELDGLADELRHTAADDRFQEAVIWQNRKAYVDAVRRLARSGGPSPRNARRREHEALVAGYLQRYCVKNDSIGFFGPVGWAQFTDDGGPLRVTPGAELLAGRTVFFEQWGLDALAQALLADGELRRWIPPRRLPTAVLEQDTMRLPGRTVPLPPARAAVLRSVLDLCDGRRTALEVVEQLPVASADEGLALLDSLRSVGLIVWDLELPLEPEPEAALRRVLEGVGDPDCRTDALDRLDRLVRARDVVAAAAGDPVVLDRAFDDLERTFTELTGSPPTRAHGETYGARSLVWEDCRRDGTVELGPELLDDLGPALSLLLDSARWLTRRVADGYRERFRRLYDDLALAEVRAPEFFARVQPMVLGTDQSVQEEAVREMQSRWWAVLGDLGGRRVQYRSADLRPKVDEAFAADRPGWPGARYQAPDVMIAADGPEAVAAGGYRLVLGELHVGVNTLRNNLFVAQHPDPEALFRATGRDIPEPRVRLQMSKRWLYSTRIQPLLAGPHDYRLLLGPESSWYAGQPGAVPQAEVRIGLRDGAVVARFPGGPELDLVEVLAEAISFRLVSRFQLLGTGRHTPRVTIDRLVVCRESWRFRAAELPFVREADEADRFRAAREWAAAAGIPRFVFVKVANEVKPFYVDLDCPLFVNAFAHAVRATPDDPDGPPVVTVSEMLPTAEQAWLRDRQGRQYTSEFRLIAVDR